MDWWLMASGYLHPFKGVFGLFVFTIVCLVVALVLLFKPFKTR
jgi:hypothetical protein